MEQIYAKAGHGPLAEGPLLDFCAEWLYLDRAIRCKEAGHGPLAEAAERKKESPVVDRAHE
jgi:hypothetical protein